MTTAAILWTGGKDSALAWAAVRERLDVVAMVTFVPDPPKAFLAHPLPLIEAQARAAGVPHRAVPVRAPYDQGYEAAIGALAAEGIEVLVTGDIDRVHGSDNWIVQRAQGLIEVERPLWQADRAGLLRQLTAEGWEVLCTLAYDAHFEPTLAGCPLDGPMVEALIARAKGTPFDAAGENGEYHTAVLWAPGFSQRVQLSGERVEAGEACHHLVFDGVACQPLA